MVPVQITRAENRQSGWTKGLAHLDFVWKILFAWDGLERRHVNATFLLGSRDGFDGGWGRGKQKRMKGTRWRGGAGMDRPIGRD